MWLEAVLVVVACLVFVASLAYFVLSHEGD
jgi:hypothetical protein